MPARRSPTRSRCTRQTRALELELAPGEDPKFLREAGIPEAAIQGLRPGAEILGALYLGFSHRRGDAPVCLLDFEVHRTGPEAVYVKLVMTHGDRDAREVDYGETGDGIGRNHLLLARLLETLIDALPRAGVRIVWNAPAPRAEDRDYLANLYAEMGFRGGKVLDLEDRASVERARRFSARLAARFEPDGPGDGDA